MATTNTCDRCDTTTSFFTSVEFDKHNDRGWGADRTFVTLCDDCIGPLMSLIDSYVNNGLGVGGAVAINTTHPDPTPKDPN